MTSTLSLSLRLANAARSSGRTFTSDRNWTNFSLFVPIWSRYCWNVMPCWNCSLVTIQASCSAHFREVDRGPPDLFLLDPVPDDQVDGPLVGQALDREHEDVARRPSIVGKLQRRVLGLDERRLHFLPADQQHRVGVPPREVDRRPHQRDLELDLPLPALDRLVAV